jgi:hypothetical protein
MTRWPVNGMVNGGGLLSQHVDDATLYRVALGGLDSPPVKGVPKAFPTAMVADDPGEAGWILVVPDDAEGTRIARELAPLVEHRARLREPASGAKPRRPEELVKRFPVTARLQPELGKWFAANIAFLGSLGESEEPPFYVLVAGPPGKIPFDLDHLLALGEFAVGRLAFLDPASYGNYARKVIAWEPDDDAARSPRKGVPVGVFATDHGVRDPTNLSRKFLADPLLPRLLAKDPGRPSVACIGEDASRDALLSLLRGAHPAMAGPRLLFSATHGLAVPGTSERAREDRLARQGGICCQDFPYLDSELLAADALGDGGLLSGGIWLLFACFGAGTPPTSDFFRSLRDPELLGMYEGAPFVAGLPTQLLANPDGPLAVIGHLDPGFIHSFSDPEGIGGERRIRLFKVLDLLLLNGCRVGVAARPVASAVGSFGEELRQVAARTAELLGRAVGASDVEIGAALDAASDPALVQMRDRAVNLAVSLNDFRNFTILGDPAVKLPRAGAKPTRAAPSAGVRAFAFLAAEGGVPQTVARAHREGRLVLAGAEDLFSPAGVGHLMGESTVILLVSSPCHDVSGVHLLAPEAAVAGSGRQRYFEAAEHQDCDLDAVLRFSETEVVPAPRARLRLSNEVKLRYGEAISLFGDFYGIPGVRVGDGEAQFMQVFGTFNRGDPAEMCRILGAMGKERALVDGAKGDDVTAAYAKAGQELNGAYNGATGGGSFISALFPRGRFLELAGVNFDHFGDDAVAAYRAGHAAACREAQKAAHASTPGDARRLLELAYLMNACADHFLTDLFASGHLRVPRRALHQQISIGVVGDLLAKRMHDEDNTRGLHVKNRRGEAWRAFGDQHFHAAENEIGRRLAREAVRTSAAEVWDAYRGNAEPAHAALTLTPDLADALHRLDNHAPMFIVEGGTLKMRKDAYDLTCRQYTADFVGAWELLRSATQGGG